MTAIAEAPGPTIGWTPIMKALPWIICTGIGITAGSAIALDAGNVEGYDIGLINEPVEGYTPQPPPIGNPGLEVPEMPVGNILNIDQPQLEPGERTRIGQQLMDDGYWGNASNTHVVVTSPGTLGEFAKASHIIHDLEGRGFTRDEAWKVAADSSSESVGKALMEMKDMKAQVVLITDKDILAVVKLTHNGNLDVYTNLPRG